MKKSVIMLSFSVLVLCFCLGILACADENVYCTEHKLTYVEVEPTCTEAGFLYIQCLNCPYEEKTNFVPAEGHVLTSKNVVSPSCTTEGYTTGKCAVCEETVITDFVSALGHDFSENTVKPSCTEQGYTQYVCNACNYSEIGNYTNPTGHKYGKIIVVTSAKCEMNGLGIYRCTVCNNEINVDIPATGHSYLEKITEPTCEEEGYTTYICKKCECSYSDNYISALGHSVAVCEFKEADCTSDGFVNGSYCERCGKVFEAEKIIPAKGHTEIIDEAVEATCTDAGMTAGKHCSVCKKVLAEQEKIAPKGHCYELLVVEPTCTENGYTVYKCVRCDEAFTDEFTNPKGHSFGINDEYCSICGAVNPDYIGYERGLTMALADDICGESSTTDDSTTNTLISTTVINQPDYSENLTPLTETVMYTEANCSEAPTQSVQSVLPETATAAKKTTNPVKINGEWINKKQKKASIKKINKGKKCFKLYWKKVSGITGYQIQYSTDKKFKKNKKTVTVNKNKTTSLKVTKLKSKKKYYIRIRTYKLSKINGKKVKVYSSWSSIKSVTVK
ncbi:MAG: fibronectin type III domain-containing protein [Eubacterium sp.]